MSIEDFTTYTEVDPNSRITKTSSKVSWTSLQRQESAWVYYDKGAAFFGDDFAHSLTVNLSAASSGGFLMYWALTNVVEGFRTIDTANGDGLFLQVGAPTGTDETVIIVELDGGVYYANGYTLPGEMPHTVYVKLVRDESVGTYGTLYGYIYSDSARTNLLTTLSITLHSSKKDYRYIFACETWVDDGSLSVTGYTENLSLSSGPSGSPTVTTQECTDTTALTSTGHGLYTTEGDSSVTQHGHVWSTSANPTTSDSKTENGAAPNLGQFSSNITGLTPGTLYYVRAYAINTEGTNYGSDVTITTGTTIGKRYIWTESTDFHYFDAYGTERVLQGHAVASDKDILPWLAPWS